ncbi:hypothetical protein [Flavobacterium sp.]|uniref:hypothetical protein n=1 Tax=Flavobacterium sp. TaxID=239 RepID=UPI001B547329|nr:hypothetical protein [Flavobacterium sp.]MBP6183103.1 hypothetical protein [Flavobacterium sp.]
MKSNFNLKNITPYLIALVSFLFITFLYFTPLLSGKVLSMHDVNMYIGNSKELLDFHEKTGTWSWWTNSIFGGMPSFMITGGYPYSLSSKIGPLFYDLLPAPANVIFLLMIGFFIFMKTLNKNNAISIISSIAYALGTYNLLYTEAGHLAKIVALAYAPPLLAGFILIFNKKYLTGTIVTSLFLALELYANHLQITYYFFFVLLAYSIYRIFDFINTKNGKEIYKVALALFISALIGIGMNGQRLWSAYTYSKETTRGISELKTSSSGENSLDKDYAFGWSYGIDESFNLIIPNLMGGGSAGSLTKKSETYKVLTSGGVDSSMSEQFIQQLPLYFGDQSSTSGPAYSGILIFFLFTLGLFISKDQFRWTILGLVVFFLLLALGKNLPIFNNFIFDFLPGYNKFRAVTMSLTVVHFLLVWGAANCLSNLFNEEKKSWDEIKRPTLYTSAILIGLMFIGYSLVNFSGPNDQGFKTSLSGSLGSEFSNRVLVALQSDRADLAFNDIIRGIILIFIMLTTIFFFTKNKISSSYFGIITLLLITFDLFSVGKRYFNNSDFMNKSQAKVVIEPSAADLEILKDKDPNYRVLNLTTAFWSDARDAYFHKSIGGYHGAKLKKIQELYDYQMVKDGKLNFQILNMLNTKYLISNNEQNQPIVQKNPDVLGNAWLIDTLKVIETADQELNYLEKINPRTTAVTQSNQGLKANIYTPSVEDNIKLISYAPNKLIYSVSTKANQFAVFSEIYYRGNKDWKSFLDGAEVSHQKVNYILRGMEIPSGKHEITFEFRPESVEKGKFIDLAASVSFILIGLVSIIITKKK